MTASIGSILSNARSAMAASQAAINTTTHNIANAQTEGYSRKRVELVTGVPAMMPYGELGTGVRIQDIGRVRDRLLDVTFRNQTTNASAYNRRGELLSQIESLYGEPSASGLSSSLDVLWNSWADLGNDPQNDAARMVTRQAGQNVANQLERLAGGLDQLRETSDLRLRQEVGELNQYTAQVAALNQQIVAAESSGQTAGDLRDARDRAIDAIASIATVTVLERSDGSAAVIAGDATLVDGNDSQTLGVDTTGGTYRLVSARGTVVSAPGGSTGATMAVLNTDIPAAMTELDAIAQALVSSVNALHTTGMSPDGQTGINFFDDLGDVTTVTARNLKLSDEVLADHRAIAAGAGVLDTSTGTIVYAAGANDVATGLATLRDDPLAALGNRSIGAYYSTAVTRVGTDVRAAVDTAAVNETLASQADIRRQSVSGVSIDEELVQLIRFQNAYAAAARVITAADELFATVIDMMR
ncbi:MAG: flagellar hook-associated protein FlgK [Longimicrobiales bacterium]